MSKGKLVALLVVVVIGVLAVMAKHEYQNSYAMQVNGKAFVANREQAKAEYHAQDGNCKTAKTALAFLKNKPATAENVNDAAYWLGEQMRHCR